MEDINTLTQKANSGDAVAMRKLGYEYLIGKNIQKDEKKAFQLFRAAVWEGDLNATIYCGYCCKTGAGLEKPNIVAAARYYEYGARAGVAAAQYELARIYIDKEMGDACFIGSANPYIGCERWLKRRLNKTISMQKNSLQINTMKVPILLRMSKLQFTGTKKLQIRVVSMQCIKQATSTTLCQLTIIKLDSGSLLQRKKAIRMLKMYCATI